MVVTPYTPVTQDASWVTGYKFLSNIPYNENTLLTGRFYKIDIISRNMSALKKRNISHNISVFLNNNILILFFNYNHMSIEEWRVLKNTLLRIKKINTLRVKNKIAGKIVYINTKKNNNLEYIKGDACKNLLYCEYNTNSKNTPVTCNQKCIGVSMVIERVYTLFQGPTFLMGIDSPEYLKQLFNVIKKQNKLIFVGGFYRNKEINHLDLEYLLKIEKGVDTELVNSIQSSLYLSILSLNSVNLYYLLKCYQNKKSLKI